MPHTGRTRRTTTLLLFLLLALSIPPFLPAQANGDRFPGGDAQAAESRVRDLAAEVEPFEVEVAVNNAGYALLQAGRTEEAIAVFEINTRVFPESWNAWDSLGEAHMEAGDTGAAVRYYERSLELNPDNENAVEMIARMRGGEGQGQQP
jgi:tetratricopeptide (TPR) repeat protein